MWLPNGHLQTIWPYLLPRPAVPFRRERVATPDGDFWDFDWLASGDERPDAPLVVLMHGLEGSSASHYARALMVALRTRGWHGVVPHFRGCSGELNLMRSFKPPDCRSIRHRRTEAWSYYVRRCERVAWPPIKAPLLTTSEA